MIAAAEILPVIGQIVSLIELGIIKFFVNQNSNSNTSLQQPPNPAEPPNPGPQPTSAPEPCLLPQPVSCRPNISVVKYEEPDTNFTRFWPSDLKLLGITQEEQKVIDDTLKEGYKNGFPSTANLFLGKKRLQCKNLNEDCLIDQKLPISITAIKINNMWQFILLPKTVFLKTGEREIRWSYNLSTGVFLLKKRITGIFEEKIIKAMNNIRAARGLSTFNIWREVQGKDEKPKKQLVEPLRDGNLSILFGTQPFQNFANRYSLIQDFLKDLAALHDLKISNASFTLKNPQPFFNNKTINLPPYFVFHQDLKFENLLVVFENNKWRGEICDFGAAAGNPGTFIISTGFTPPEYIKFYNKVRPWGLNNSVPWSGDNQALINFNIEHALARDIWAMGLILLAILVGRTQVVNWESEDTLYKATIAPLQCLKNCINSVNQFSHYQEEDIINLTQGSLDTELNQLQQEVEQNNKDHVEQVKVLFEIVRNMLRINPKERSTIIDIVKRIEEPQPITSTIKT